MKRTTRSFYTVATALFLVPFVYSQNSREITKTIPLKADGEVTIDTYKGSINITTWDKPQVEIHVVIEADDNLDTRYSAEEVRDTDIRIDATQSRVRIKTNYEDINDRRHGFFSWFEGGSGSLPLVHYAITMPATANLSIKDYKSRSLVQNLRADLKFDTYKGDVEITGLEGSLNLETYRGEARIDFNALKDRSSCKTFKGTITMTLPKKSGFNLEADLGYHTRFSTDFSVELPDRGRHHRDIEFHEPINGGGSLLVLRSTKGNIRLRER